MAGGRYGRAVGIAAGETFVVLAPFAKVSKSARPSTVVKGTKEARNVERVLIRISRSKGNVTEVVGNKKGAIKVAEKFVGRGAEQIIKRDTKKFAGWKSADGLKIVRIEVKKSGPHKGREVINLMTKKTPKGKEYISNIHLIWE